MNIYIITVCHTNINVIWSGVSNVIDTVGVVPARYILLDHLYPRDKFNVSKKILSLAEAISQKYQWNIDVIRPLKNMGGHGGFNWALSQIPIFSHDIVLGVDPDSNIITKDWGKKMIEVFNADKTIGALSLLHDAIVPHNENEWKKECIADTTVGFLNKPEMFNVTGWRGDFLNLTNGIHAKNPYYGHVEVAMREKSQKAKYRLGYLLDYKETFQKVSHDEIYNKWKAEAVAGEKRNFDEWLTSQQTENA